MKFLLKKEIITLMLGVKKLGNSSFMFLYGIIESVYSQCTLHVFTYQSATSHVLCQFKRRLNTSMFAFYNIYLDTKRRHKLFSKQNFHSLK